MIDFYREDVYSIMHRDGFGYRLKPGSEQGLFTIEYIDEQYNIVYSIEDIWIEAIPDIIDALQKIYENYKKEQKQYERSN